jgi:hypothetical protein
LTDWSNLTTLKFWQVLEKARDAVRSGDRAPLLRLLARMETVLQNIFIQWFLESQLPHKIVNLLFPITN